MTQPSNTQEQPNPAPRVPAGSSERVMPKAADELTFTVSKGADLLGTLKGIFHLGSEKPGVG